ncbi:helix-turn-helix domain-containing protein [Pseudonocardia acaciae]|uniref:helix-turn-helix domain-containing protein n=1 Tax=Pseudonocardia acaciae TaxID=551276 RepID=UPI0005632B43|nr:helix-turn-helix transcriptional regulator [Pseudonocardia acaciae]
MTLLLREAIGDSLRRARTSRHRTLREVSHQARVSLGYLSEVERGRKEASSELLAAICEALDLPLSELLDEVAESMRPVPAAQPLVPIGTRHADIRRAVVTRQPAGPSPSPATALVRMAA